MKAYFTVLFLLIIGISNGQVTNVKAGIWSDQTVWSNGLIPSSKTNITLSYNIVVDINADCESLNTNGHSVTVNTGISLNVAGNGSFTDPRDGQVYSYKTIGTQVWMTQNLNYNAAGSWCYDNSQANCDIYGRLYDWNTAITVAPPGWHLPSNAEWTTLINYLGGEFAGEKMKETGTVHWQSPNYGANNSSGFTGLPGGNWYYSFSEIGQYGYWWSSTAYSSPNWAWCTYLNWDGSNAVNYYFFKEFGFSVRCIRD